ncbi:hypothetical protein CEXT_377461 [Caerostris extrusa]|uniref:Uncharacterized protein n=1 Tax=Caerostris extrusa TaxID=172846 RepID=A0AAV4XRG0_CAEEX|nr:hypothetical protein CEXT_377461 [Caerostris extrusa]
MHTLQIEFCHVFAYTSTVRTNLFVGEGVGGRPSLLPGLSAHPIPRRRRSVCSRTSKMALTSVCPVGRWPSIASDTFSPMNEVLNGRP